MLHIWGILLRLLVYAGKVRDEDDVYKHRKQMIDKQHCQPRLLDPTKREDGVPKLVVMRLSIDIMWPSEDHIR
jgi:hypothetical protein